MIYPRFDPPAFQNDFTTEAQRNAWSAEVASYFSTGVDYNNGFPGNPSQFYDPTKTDTPAPFSEPVIDWPGFPKLVRDEFPSDLQAWKAVDTASNNGRDLQDEYLEWNVVKNAAGKITRVSFTCETRQYFEFLAKSDQPKLLEIYKQLVDPAQAANVKATDLVVGSTYQPRNKWNTKHGAVHLIQPNNNLFAEVMIAAQACILRKRPDGTPITDSDELIRCSDYGEPGRASDPKIGAVVNAKARQKFSIALRNPVALYLTHWSTPGDWKKPDGTLVGNYWKLVRGKPAASAADAAMGLHLVYEVPAAEGFTVGDITVGARTIEYGGELAKQISVGLFALLCREGEASNMPYECGVEPPPSPPVLTSDAAETKYALRAK